MAKLIRKQQKLFGNTGPTGVVGQFGSYKAGAAVYSLDPDVIQNLSAYTNGFQYAGLTGNTATIQDINGLVYLLTRQGKYIHQSGIPEYSSTQSYWVNSIVTDGLGGIFSSLTDSNYGNALTHELSWFMMHGKKVTQVGNANYTALNTDWIIDWHTAAPSTGKNTINLPTPGAHLVGRVYTILQTAGDGDWLQIFTGSDYTYIDYGNNIQFICDGSKWVVVHA